MQLRLWTIGLLPTQGVAGRSSNMYLAGSLPVALIMLLTCCALSGEPNRPVSRACVEDKWR